MRDVVLGLGISIDGYIARPNGAVDFLFMPKDYSMADFRTVVRQLLGEGCGLRRVDRLVLMLVDYEPPKPPWANFEPYRSLSNGVQ